MKPTVAAFAILFLLIMLPVQARSFANQQAERTSSVVRPEKTSATIEKSLHDLQSQDPAVRMGAAMLLSKYQTPAVRAALLKTLQDQEVRIRYAALISLLENRTFNKPFNTTPILVMISDPDPGIRRQVSLYSGNLMSQLRLFASRPRGSGIGLHERLNKIPNYQKIKTDLKKAFFDQDVDVRRNMVKNYHKLGLKLPVQDRIRLLADPDREVRIVALRIVARTAHQKFIDLAAELIEADDPQWNMALASELGRPGQPAAVPILQTLSLNINQEVAIEAAVSLFQIDPSSPQDRPIYRKLAANELPASLAVRVIKSLRKLDNETARNSLEGLLQLKNRKSRSTAIQNWLLCFKSLPDPERLKEFLQDESPEVRRTTASLLVRFSKKLPPDLIEEILFHPDENVRIISFTIGPRLPPERQDELYLDLLIDESIQIRKRALSDFISKRRDGWQKYAAASLRDRSKDIRNHAVRLLGQKNLPGGLDILRSFVKENPEADIASHIREVLAQKKQRSGQP